MWREKPTSIVNYEKECDYVIAIDESGTPNLSYHKNDEKFTLVAVMIKSEDYDNTSNEILNLKEKHWRNGRIKGKRVVFHYRDIFKKCGEFSDYKIINDDLQSDLFKFITFSDLSYIAVHIDKKKLVEQYKKPHDVYDLAMTFLLERITLFLNRNKKRAVILVESRGKKEDIETLRTVKKLKINGNDFISSKTFDVIDGIYFDKKRTSCRKKSFWQLEVSDIICYTLHRYYTVGDNEEQYNQVKSKQLKNKSSFKMFP